MSFSRLPVMEGNRIRSLGQFDPNGIFGAFSRVVLRELGPQAPGLNAHHGIYGRVEVRGAAEFLGRNLMLLEGCSGMLDGVVRQVAKQLAERLRPMEHAAVRDLLHLSQ